MHGEHLVVGVGRQDGCAGASQLESDEQCVDSADDEEEDAGRAVHDADALVIDGEQPAPPAGAALRPGKCTERPRGLFVDLTSLELERCISFDDGHQRLLDGSFVVMNMSVEGDEVVGQGVDFGLAQPEIGHAAILRGLRIGLDRSRVT